jgi:uncharacterized protein
LPSNIYLRQAAPDEDDVLTVALVNGAELHLDHHGAAWWPAERMLVVADMHLEKGSAFARRGRFLPPYDSAATLARLARLVARHRPRRLVALGDSFHDRRAGERMDGGTMGALQALAAGLDVVWIAGNHDPEIPAGLRGERLGEYREGPLVFRHEPRSGAQAGEIAGHLHPAAKVVSARGGVRRPAFVTDGMRLVMPAFGAYAGGLNCREPAIERLFRPEALVAHVLGEARVYAVGPRRLAPD